MEAYKNLYSDPKSPLSPIPPIPDSFNCNLLKTTPKTVIAKKPVVRTLAQRAQNQAANKARDIPRKPLIRIENPHGESVYNNPNRPCLQPSNSKLHQKRVEAKLGAGAGQHRCHCQCKQKLSQQKVEQKQYRAPSPVAPRALSPRIDNILKEAGLHKYAGLLKKEEIDYFVFKMLLEKDLTELGIPKNDIPSFMETIRKVSH